MKEIKTDGELERLEKQIRKERLIPEIKSPAASFKALDEETACNIFKAYFNNKMTVILFLLQKRMHEQELLTTLRAEIFFDDLFHHMLKREYQKKYHRVFQWLKLFFRRFPYVKPVQKRKAIEYVSLVYRLMGIQFNLNI